MTSATDASPSAPTGTGGGRRATTPWTLQRRLILTTISIVSVILILVAVSTSAILGRVLEQRLADQVRAAASTASWIGSALATGATAADILRESPTQSGFLLAIETTAGVSGAVRTDDGVLELTTQDIRTLSTGLTSQQGAGVDLGDVGAFQVQAIRTANGIVVVGVSRADIARTLGDMLTTIVLLTTGGLVLLAGATAWTIRSGLRPLRAVADTATRVSRLPLDRGSVSIHERVPEAEADPRTETGQVGAALNALLDHVDASLDARQRNEERMRRFVADASHELRTPLASIRGYSELSLRAIAKGTPDAAEGTTEALHRIEAQSVRMTRLVEDLLLLARLDEGRELVYGSVDLSQLAVEATGDARVAGPDHHWRVEVDEEPVIVAGDAGRLHQVAANLLANARTHTPAGTTVTVTATRDGNDAVLRVHDDGPGIDPSVREELFERFARADVSRARASGGTGLGLSIARAIAGAHHGTIDVDSSPGSTTFTLRVPARPADPDPNPAPEETDPQYPEKASVVSERAPRSAGERSAMSAGEPEM